MWRRMAGAAAAVIVYGVVSSIVVAMAQGYTWDLNQQKVVMTSVLELNSFPTGAHVSVDDQLLKQLTPLSVTEMPGAYTVTVQKDNYYPWRFSTVLAPQLLTQIPQVPLFPEANAWQPLVSSEPVIRVETIDQGQFFVSRTTKALHWWQDKNGTLKEIFSVQAGTDELQYTCQSDGAACLVIKDNQAYILDLNTLIMHHVEGRPLLYGAHQFFHFHDNYYLLSKQANAVTLQKIANPITSQVFLADADAFTLLDNKVFFAHAGAIWEQSLITGITDKLADLANRKQKVQSLYANQLALVWQTTDGSIVIWDRNKSQSVGLWDNGSLMVHDQFIGITNGAKAWVLASDRADAIFLGQMSDTINDLKPYNDGSWLISLPNGQYVLVMQEPQIQNTFHAPYAEITVLSSQMLVANDQNKLYYHHFPTTSWFGSVR